MSLFGTTTNTWLTSTLRIGMHRKMVEHYKGKGRGTLNSEKGLVEKCTTPKRISVKIGRIPTSPEGLHFKRRTELSNTNFLGEFFKGGFYRNYLPSSGELT